MKALIVDDEPVARRNLRELFEEFPDVEVAGEAATGEEALEQIQRVKPDVVFLDLQMPGLDGFGVVRSLRGELRPLVVHVTAHGEHAVTAFETGAIDYLLKPVRPERMAAALEKVRSRLLLDRPERSARRPEWSFGKIAGRRGADLHLFDASEVIAFQADGDVVYLLTQSGRYYANRPLKELERDLPQPPYRRVHRRTIINTDHIRKISPLSSKRWLLTMSNGLEVVVSKRMTGIVREAVR